MEGLKINHAAVWVGVVVLFALGFVWYDLLFGEQWVEFVGLDMAEIEANPPGYGLWISNIIASALGMYLLAWLFAGLNITSGSKGAIVGFLIAFVFIFLTTMINNMYAQRPYGLAWILGGYSMVGYTINGFIIGAWTMKK
jgi:hypothetical protein|tara:strand:- start:494 stop:913 length:420 start_codon:yes stop_codon:yes gene_type:complete